MDRRPRTDPDLDDGPPAGGANLAAELRGLLDIARREGEPFDDAWSAAFEALSWSHASSVEREAWSYGLRTTKSAWALAYAGQSSRQLEDVARLEHAA